MLRLLVCLLLLPLVAQAQEGRFLRIATGSASDTYFALGTLIASAISSPPGSRPCGEGGGCGVPGLIAVAQTSQGGIANLSAIGARQVELGLAQADVADWAYRGAGPFVDKGANNGLRAIAALYQVTIQVVVRRDAMITQVAGLRGKRVSLGPADSGALFKARAILDAHGLGESDIDARLLTTDLALDQLRAGRIDAVFLFATPNDRVAELAEDGGIDVLPIEGPPAAALRALHPILRDAVLPAGTYPGVPLRRTLGIATLLVGSDQVDEGLVHAVTKALWHETARPLLARGLPRGAAWKLENALDGVAIPVHPGALKFYREAGVPAAAGK